MATEVDDEMFHPSDNRYRACDVQWSVARQVYESAKLTLKMCNV